MYLFQEKFKFKKANKLVTPCKQLSILAISLRKKKKVSLYSKSDSTRHTLRIRVQSDKTHRWAFFTLPATPNVPGALGSHAHPLLCPDRLEGSPRCALSITLRCALLSSDRVSSLLSVSLLRCFPQSFLGKGRSSRFVVACLWTSHPPVFYEQTQYLLPWVQVRPHSEEDRIPPPCA